MEWQWAITFSFLPDVALEENVFLKPEIHRGKAEIADGRGRGLILRAMPEREFSSRPNSNALDPAHSAAHQKKTRQQHAEEKAQDYVEAIADLIASCGEARATDLARCMGVSHVTVIRTVQRLQKEGLVTTEPYRSIFLTEEGEELAIRSRRRHQLIIDFLEALGVPPQTAAADAEGIEHHVSMETLDAFGKFLKSKA